MLLVTNKVSNIEKEQKGENHEVGQNGTQISN